jgi:hypothetical protein
MSLVRSACVVAFLLLSPQTVFAQNPTWTVGQHAQVYYSKAGTMMWRPVTVTEVFSWGVHARFDDEPARIETFTTDTLQPVGNAPRAAQPIPPAAQAQRVPQAARPAAAASSATDPATTSPVGAGNLDAAVKRAIYTIYSADVDGTTAAPLSIGVTFDQFQIGAPIRNMRDDGYAEYPDAAENTPIYPVRTRHTYCRVYRNATTRTDFAGRYICYKDRFGGFVCGTTGGHALLGYR